MTKQATEFQDELREAIGEWANKHYQWKKDYDNHSNWGDEGTHMASQKLEALIARAVDKKALAEACSHIAANESWDDEGQPENCKPEYWIAKAEENKGPKGYTCPEGHSTDFPMRGFEVNYSTGETRIPTYCKRCDKYYEENK